MLGWKSKSAIEDTPEAAMLVHGEEPSTWSDGTWGPMNPVSRIFGRQRGDADCEARLATAD
jgi:hypothetical protein